MGEHIGGGTSRAAGLQRLARDRPDLLAEVEAGSLSVNGASVLAGHRHRMITVRGDDPAEFVRAGLRVYSRESLVRALRSDDD